MDIPVRRLDFKTDRNVHPTLMVRCLEMTGGETSHAARHVGEDHCAFDLLERFHERGLVWASQISRGLAAWGHSGELAHRPAGIRIAGSGQSDRRRSVLAHAVEDHPGSHFRQRLRGFRLDLFPRNANLADGLGFRAHRGRGVLVQPSGANPPNAEEGSAKVDSLPSGNQVQSQ